MVPAATHFSVSAPSTATAGAPISFTVTALDQSNSTAADYAGTVHFTSSDGSAVLPADLPLTNGVGTFSATLKTAGGRTITATDTTTSSITGTSSSIVVSAAAATHFSVVAPASTTSGGAFNVAVTALDAFNNTVTGYTGTVQLTSSDGQAVLPVAGTLPSGSGSFNLTLKTAGNQTVTATDTTTSSITGTSNAIGVSTAPLITSAAKGTFGVQSASSFTVTTSGFPAATITESGALPTGVTFHDNGDGTASLSGTPAAIGSFPITFTAHNGTGADATQKFTLTVSGIPPYATTLNQRFVAQVYIDLLGRFVEQSALNFWTGPIDQGGTRSVFVLAIAQSAEYRIDQVQSLYQHYFSRPADPAGLQAAVAFLNAGGSYEQVAASLTGSLEYFRGHGGNSNTGFPSALYEDALGRAIDANALAAQSAALNTGMFSFKQLAQFVLTSTEYSNVFVSNSYQTFLHRSADPAGLAFFVQAMRSGMTDDQVIAVLIGSDEYLQTRVGA